MGGMPSSTTDNAVKSDARNAFQKALSPKDRVIHDLAVKMLKTRYTPERSNAWAKWAASQKK